MNSEYSRNSQKHSALGSNFYRLRRLKQRQEGRSGSPNPMILVLAKLLLLVMEICSWQGALAALTLRNNLGPSPGLQSADSSIFCQNGATLGIAIAVPKTLIHFRNYLVYRIFNILFQNCLSQ
jgi:hypothetical protein